MDSIAFAIGTIVAIVFIFVGTYIIDSCLFVLTIVINFYDFYFEGHL